MYNRIISYIKKNVLPKLESLPTDVAGVKEAFNAWKVDWTKARAARLDNLDAKVSTRASAQDVTTVGTKVDGMGTTITALDAKVDKVGVDAAKAASIGGFDYASDTTAVPDSFNTSSLLITGVDLPNCETIGNDAFKNIKSLDYCNAPKIKSIGTWAFSATNISKVDFPLCETVGASAFSNCNNLESVSLPKVTRLNGGVFSACNEKSKPFTVDLPNVVSVGSASFHNANIEYLDLPNCTEVETDGFISIGGKRPDSSDGHTKKVRLPKLRRTTYRAFMYACFETIDFGALEHIISYTFGFSTAPKDNACAKNFVLRTPKVCTLESNAFTSSSTKPEYPPLNIYVPDNLVASYKTASNWSRYADRIKPLSQYVEV